MGCRTLHLLVIACAAAVAAGEIDLDHCGRTLGLEDGRISAEQLTASSSHEPSSVGANAGRLNVDVAGGAWCPRALIDSEATEFIEVDLGAVHAVTAVLTQGRFGNGHGQEFAEAYFVEYTRPGLDHYVRHVSSSGSTVFPANTNTYSVVENTLDPPALASRIRIVPFSRHQRTVCMRIELKGCPYSDGIVSYSATTPYKGDRDNYDLGDDSYDGVQAGGLIHSGLGQLTDGVLGEKGSLEEAASLLRDTTRHAVGGYSWVGWKNESFRPIEIGFFFDRLRNVEAVKLDEHPEDDRVGMGYVTRVVMECRVGNATKRAFVFEDLSSTETLEMRPSKKCVGDNVRLLIHFHNKWLALGEVSFVSNVALEEDDDERSDILGFKEHRQALNTPRNLSNEIPESADDTEIDIFEVTERQFPEADNEPIRDDWEARYLGAAIGVLVTVIVLLLIVVVVILYRDRRSRNKVTRRYSSVSNFSGNSFPDKTNTINIYKARLFGTDDGALSTLPHQQPNPVGPNVHPMHHHAIYSEPIFTLDNKTAAAAAAAGEEFSEYASPLLLYTPSPSMIRTNAGYADPQRLRRMQNLSQGQQQQHHSLQHNHLQQRSEPNWEEFFPPPPPPPPQSLQQKHKEQEASVACYASTEICKPTSVGTSTSSPSSSTTTDSTDPFV